MTGMDVQTQTQYRDGESHTSFFHLLLPPAWQVATPDPWVLAGCPVGFPKTRQLVDDKKDASEHWFARPKEKEKNIVPFVFPTKPRDHANFSFLEENRCILEPFASLPSEELEELEPRVAFKVASCRAYSLPPYGLGAVGSNWLSRFPQGLSKHAALDGSSPSVEQSRQSKSNQRNYAAYLGRHRKILTPRCDPLLVVRMERANAVVLLQRCLRGRAAQIKLAETRLRVLELYPELNELEDQKIESKEVAPSIELGNVKALVGRQLFNLYNSMLMSLPSTSNVGDASKEGSAK